MSTATATPTTVHVTIPGFAALSERGYWNACAVIAEADALHVCPWNAVPLVGNTIAAWRWQYIEYGHWSKVQSQGTTLDAIYWHLTQTAIHAHVAGYIPYSGAPDLAKLHAFIKAQCLAQNPVIIQVVNAQALSHNEQGVFSHFVTLGGIDSTLGYLTANGDTTDALTTAAVTVPLYWNTWAQLVAAKICGAIALERVVPVTPPPTPPPSVSPSELLPLVDSALSALQSLKAKLGG